MLPVAAPKLDLGQEALASRGTVKLSKQLLHLPQFFSDFAMHHNFDKYKSFYSSPYL